MISHDLAAIKQTTHRIIYIDQSVQYDGKPEDLPELEILAGLRGIKKVHGDSGEEMKETRNYAAMRRPRNGTLTSFNFWSIHGNDCTNNSREFFPYFFTMEMFQRSLIASILVTITACLMGSFLLLRNLALIGDGLAHVSFGGIAIAIAMGSTAPLWYALFFSVISSVIIYELQSREILSGDASIAIFLTGMLGLGLVVLRIWGGGITTDIEGYMFGSLLLVDNQSLNLIIIIFVITLISIFALYRGLLQFPLDPVSAEVQGLPVRYMGLWFSILTALVVVSMVKITGTLLATALLVTPAATAQQVSRSFKQALSRAKYLD